MNMGNIFEAYYCVRQKILDNLYDYSSPEYMKVLQSVKTYFDSFVWVSNDMDRLIYLYAGKGLNNGTIAEYIGINVNTYRSKVSRLSAKLSGILFDGRKLEDACLYDDILQIKETRIYIDQLNNRLVIGKELSSYMLEKISNITLEANKRDAVTEEEKFQALLFVASFSEPAIENKLNQIQPAALDFVMNELFGSKFSEWSLYYKKCSRKCLICIYHRKKLLLPANMTNLM